MTTPAHRFNFSKDNPAIRDVATDDPDELGRHIDTTLKQNRRMWGYGGWGEHREFYGSDVNTAHKSIHLGIDIWLPERTPLFAPFTGSIFAFKNTATLKGSGPVIITEHAIGNTTFWILYSNLSGDSLNKVTVGKTVRSGDTIARVGGKHENGGWPPHVHLQIISDIEKLGDQFPQYAKQAEKDTYLQICPNPESLIKPFLVA